LNHEEQVLMLVPFPLPGVFGLAFEDTTRDVAVGNLDVEMLNLAFLPRCLAAVMV